MTAKFTKGKADSILAAGKSLNDVRIFKRDTGEVVGKIEGFKNMIYSLDLSYEGDQFCVGNVDGSVSIFENH